MIILFLRRKSQSSDDSDDDAPLEDCAFFTMFTSKLKRFVTRVLTNFKQYFAVFKKVKSRKRVESSSGEDGACDTDRCEWLIFRSV